RSTMSSPKPDRVPAQRCRASGSDGRATCPVGVAQERDARVVIEAEVVLGRGRAGPTACLVEELRELRRDGAARDLSVPGGELRLQGILGSGRYYEALTPFECLASAYGAAVSGERWRWAQFWPSGPRRPTSPGSWCSPGSGPSTCSSDSL